MGRYRRARSAEQKNERFDTIMDAAEALFKEKSYHEITMGTVAERLGWSRSNLYKYAATLEEVFLALHSRANRRYVEDLAVELSSDLPSKAFARKWAQITGRHSEFLRYQEILTEIIESNVSLEKLTNFKRAFVEMLEPLTTILIEQTRCSQSEATDLYLRLVYQAAPLHAQFHFSEKTTEAMRLAGMAEITGTFEDAYAPFVEMCLQQAARL